MIHWLVVHLRWWWKDLKVLVQRSVTEFADDRCTQIAASISYYVFFSIFPLAIFLVTIFGQVLRNEKVKQQVIDALLEVIPLAPAEGRQELEQVLAGVTTNVSLLGLLSVVGLIWSASAMMGALRNAMNIAWDTDFRRPPIRGKIIDIFMVLIVGLLVAVSLAATGLRPFVQDWITDVGQYLPFLESILQGAMWLATFLIPILVSFLIFSSIYRFVPAVATSFDEIWPGALFAAVTFEIAKVGFAFYIRNFGDYNAIYGSLGAVVVFMLFIFIAANILLMGAEIASEWPRVLAGHYDRGLPERPEEEEEPPFRTRVRALVYQAFFISESPEHVDDDLIEERARQRSEIRARQIARLREMERAPESPDEDSTPSSDD